MALVIKHHPAHKPTMGAGKMAYSVQYTKCIGSRADEGVQRPFWHQLEAYGNASQAMHRARQYALDNGGYVCVKDSAGTVIYGTDPVALDRAIILGINRYFTQPRAA